MFFKAYFGRFILLHVLNVISIFIRSPSPTRSLSPKRRTPFGRHRAPPSIQEGIDNEDVTPGMEQIG